MAVKCKSASHVRALPSASSNGDRAGVWTCTYVEHGACKNVPGYGAELYVLTHNGKLGLQMLPDLARVLPGQLREAARMAPAVRIEHKKFGVWNPRAYATLSRAAAVELADAIEAVVG